MSLHIENLEVSYGAIKALHGVTLKVEEGEIVTIIGANGAGKTTLIRAISGVIPKKAGQVFYRGQNITRMPPHKIVSAGVVQVPEGRLIFQNLTVKENLELGAFSQKKIHFQSDLEEVFALFPRLKERFHQKSDTLSGGEQQMLAIGRALVARPRFLLLDEPSLGLAPNLVQQIFKSLKTIHAKGVSLLLVEQDAHLALKTAHRGYVMETGKIILEGNADTLLGNPEVQKAYLGL
ncbi:MAG: ABC transporter ATP-binding protein [Deltaproteobacteria bacterium]|nr:ABC transporter ATP-binding protein [Deltaproteobacteria bacterium]